MKKIACVCIAAAFLMLSGCQVVLDTLKAEIPGLSPIIETVGSNLENSEDSIEAGGTPGWYLTHWEYYKNPYDSTETGGLVGTFANGDTYTDYHDGRGEKNNFTNLRSRKLSNGKIAASGSATTIWTDPPEYFGANDRPIIDIKRTTESTWGINEFSVSFDLEDINPGGGTAGKINFATPDGESYVQAYDGPFQMQKAVEGRAGDKRAIIFHLNGYGFKYYYEWRE